MIIMCFYVRMNGSYQISISVSIGGASHFKGKLPLLPGAANLCCNLPCREILPFRQTYSAFFSGIFYSQAIQNFTLQNLCNYLYGSGIDMNSAIPADSAMAFSLQTALRQLPGHYVVGFLVNQTSRWKGLIKMDGFPSTLKWKLLKITLRFINYSRVAWKRYRQNPTAGSKYSIKSTKV